MRRTEVPGAARRVGIARAALLLALLGLSARAAHLSIVDRRGAERGPAQIRRVLALPPERGAIVDGRGAALALTVDADSVYAIPSEIEDLDRTARQLGRALGVDSRKLANRLRGRRSFAFLERWVEPELAERVRALALPGVGVLKEPRRVYPHKELAAQAVGFANIDGVGVRGIEQQEDEWLRGAARRLPVERDARGRLLLAAGDERWSTAGGDVALTLDATLQADAMSALRQAVERSGARGGVVVSLDPGTGDVLALAELPSFDPNRFRRLDYHATRSRAFLDAADPGSTFKAFLVAAALESGAIDEEDRFDCEAGSFRVPGKTIRDRHPHGSLRPGEILRVSSNIGAVKIAYALGPGAHFEMLRRFGFGQPTGSRFPDESAGLLRPWRSWRPVDHATLAFGQGVSVTPIQLAAATAVLASGGEWRRPRLVAARRPPRGSWRPTRTRVERRVIRPETAAAVLAMLEGAVGPGGTGRRAALRGVRVAGKTGTAQKLDPASGGYSQDRFVAWFIGVVPADDPKLVVVAGLDEPRRPTHTGGAAAAPLFARVAAAQLARFGIHTAPLHGWPPAAPKRTEDAAVRVARAPATPAAAPRVRRARRELEPVGDRVLLPDFRGFTVAEVRQITAESPLDVQISGRGRAIDQDPPPGTILGPRSTRVRVRFATGRAESGEGDG